MSIIKAIILGAIQGLTEFLPVSSSGHLVLFQHLLGLKEPKLFFDVCLHFGTLVAVVIIFRNDIWLIFKDLYISIKKIFKKEITVSKSFKEPNIKLIILIILGSIPTAIIGLFLNEIAEKLFSSVFFVGCMFFITAIILWSTKYIKNSPETKNDNIKDNQKENIKKFSYKKSILIGIVQGLAVLPGISRSGSTISFGLFFKLDREFAAKFSFLLSIPAILGAMLLELKKAGNVISLFTPEVFVGMVVSFIVGYLALKVLLYFVKQGKLYYFAPYCWVAAIVALYIGILGI